VVQETVETPLLYVAASLNFRFSDLLPLPHLLLVFTSVSSSFICIGLSFICIGLSFSLFILFIYLALPTRAGSPQQHMPITVGPFCLTHPVNFPCGSKPEYPEETHDFRQSVDFYSFSHEDWVQVALRLEPAAFVSVYLLVVSVYLLVVSVYLLVVSVYLLVVSVYDIDVFAHNINV
jgi:hypothetical protein